MITLEQLQQLRELVRTSISRIQNLEQENRQLRDLLLRYEGDMDDLSQENRDLESNQQLVEMEVSELLNELQSLQIDEVKAESDTTQDDEGTSAVPEASSSGQGAQADALDELPQINPSDSLAFMEQRENVSPMHVSEDDFDNSQQYGLSLSETVPISDSSFADSPLNEDPGVGDSAPDGGDELPTATETVTELNGDNPVPLTESMTEDKQQEPWDEEDVSHSLDISLGLDGDSLLSLEENLSALAAQESQPQSISDGEQVDQDPPQSSISNENNELEIF